MNNQALEEFVKNVFEVNVCNGEVDDADWDSAMSQLDDLITDVERLRDKLDRMTNEEKVQWLKDNDLGFWED